jgi:hypothetical protein
LDIVVGACNPSTGDLKANKTLSQILKNNKGKKKLPAMQSKKILPIIRRVSINQNQSGTDVRINITAFHMFSKLNRRQRIYKKETKIKFLEMKSTLSE